MATYVKTLKDENGDIVLPRTRKSAIQDVINEVPTDGVTNQVLTKTANGYAWQDAPTVPTNVSAFTNDAGYTKVEDNHLVANGTIKIDNVQKTVYDDSEIRQTLAGFNKGYVINGESDITGTKDSTTGNWSNVTAITGITLSELKVGDNVYLKDDTKPDFWVSQISPSVSLNTLDTKTDLSNYYNKTEVNELLENKQNVITDSNKLSASLVSGLSTVATSGNYNDLSNTPTIPTTPDLGTFTWPSSFSDVSNHKEATITISGATVDSNSKIDIQLSIEQINTLQSAGCTSCMIVNNSGTITLCIIGDSPAASDVGSVQVCVTQVTQ